MGVTLAVCSAVFAGITSILAKCGIRKTDSNTATAIRTFVVYFAAWAIAAFTGAVNGIGALTAAEWCFIAGSGLATAVSWLCYYRAIALGDVSRVAPVDKMGTVIAIIACAVVFREGFSVWRGVGLVLITSGTLLMVVTGKNTDAASKKWLIYAILSAVFAAAVSVLAKLGMQNVESNLATALRTCVVLVAATVIAACGKNRTPLREIGGKEYLFLVLSGLATAASWLCYFAALKFGVASTVIAIDKLSILVTVVFSAIFLHEKTSVRGWIGLALLVAGTLMLVFF